LRGSAFAETVISILEHFMPPVRSIIYGSRAKLGYLIPSVNLACESQLPAMAPEGVSVHFMRLKLTSANENALRAMADGLESAVDLLMDAGVSSITFHCTAVTTFAPGMDERLIERIQRASGLPATATGRAIVTALRTLGAHKVVLVTPYPSHVNEREETFLRANGFEVLANWAEGIDSGLEMFAIEPEVWKRRLLEHRHRDADAYFLSCAQIKAIEIAHEMERELGRPVITSNTAAFWQSLRISGIPDRIQGFGQLLAGH
jgi:maleate isomerase